jgi:hypothetical protein
MEFKDNKDKIKEALLQGGLVVAERGTGKTRALFEILIEEDNVAIIVPNESQRRRYIEFLKDRFPNGCSSLDLRNCIILDTPSNEHRLMGLDKNVYIDEYFLCSYRGPFKAAVTSFPFPVKVVE